MTPHEMRDYRMKRSQPRMFWCWIAIGGVFAIALVYSFVA